MHCAQLTTIDGHISVWPFAATHNYGCIHVHPRTCKKHADAYLWSLPLTSVTQHKGNVRSTAINAQLK